MITHEFVKSLIETGESLTVEFKGEEKSKINDDKIVETVVCLANRSEDAPAYLLIGVEDDGRITGARPRHESGRTDPLQLQALISSKTRPSLSCRVEVISINGKDIIVIEVPKSTTPVGTSGGKYLKRAMGGKGEPVCRPMSPHEIQSHLADMGRLDFSGNIIPGATWDDLDPLEFERFRRTIRESRGHGDASLADLPDVELAKALGAVEANHEVTAVRVLGLLLFGKEESLRRFLPTHEVAFQVISGTKVEVNEFFRLPLLRVIEEVLSRYRARNKEEEVMVGFLRVGVPDYPEPSFREGVANALIHRDYTRLGAVHIQWHPDRIEISNPGGFPEGVNLNNLLVTPPRPRNPLLADAFKRAGLVERTGRGIDIIFTEQLRNGRPAPSYERSTETDVILVLPGGKANLDFVKLIVEEKDRSGEVLKLDELLILNHLYQHRRIHTAEASQLIQKSDQEARAVLERLVERGLVEGRGERKARTYHLSPETYRRLGAEAEYVRQRGFEPIQQEQMVLQYVEKHGKITRREAAELCKIASNQARDLLLRLSKQGKLEKRGEKRGTFYVKPSKNMD